MNMLRKSILIVDDEEDLTWSISRSLRRHEDIFEVTCVSSAEAALGILRDRRIDLVISDIRMPQMDGFSLIRHIRSHYPKCQIIIMTAFGTAEIQDQANALGTFYYIEKPFEIRYLRKLIYEALAISDEGFEGLLVKSRIHDMIEFNCQTGRTHALRVSSGRGKGVIFFSKGEIVHAECDELVGENALYRILDWDKVDCAVVPSAISRRRTIKRRWQSLLNPKLIE
jgi:CheY-like chemotaxis protein